MADEIRAWMALSLCASGRPGLWWELAKTCGGALAAVRADDAQLAGHGASATAIALLREEWTNGSPRVLERSARLGLQVTAPGLPAYPTALAEIPDPPLVLFYRGAEPASCAPALAVVGARRCTTYGERTAERIGAEAAALGLVVVSGLARGVDAAAHRGALARGRTAAVLAGGLDRIYPSEHTSLAERIVAAGGTVVSEQPPGVRPLPWLFPFRNRLITGLCEATVVVEASRRSGSLASARHALDQGKDVFAVPGSLDSTLSEGTNALLAQGASVFTRTADLRGVNGFSKLLETKQAKSLKIIDVMIAGLDEVSLRVLAAVRAGAATSDEIAVATSLDGTRVLALLTALELDGCLRRETHGRFRIVRASG